MTEPQPPISSAPQTPAPGTPPRQNTARKALVIGVPLLVFGTFAVLVAIALSGPAVTQPRYGGEDAANANAGGGANGTNGANGANAAGFPRSFETAGRPIIIRQPPARVVSCTMASDEMLIDLIGLHRLAAITRMSQQRPDSMIRDRVQDFPASRLVSQVQESAERIVSWHPDLVVVASWTDPAFRDQMTRANIPVLTTPAPDSLAAIREALELLAKATGADERGALLLADFDRRLQAVRGPTPENGTGDNSANASGIGAVYLDVGGDRHLSSLGAGTLLHDVLDAAGYTNLLATESDLTGWVNELQFSQLLALDRAGKLDVLVMPEYPPDWNRPDPLQQLRQHFPGATSLSVLAADPPRVVRIPAALTSTVSHHAIKAVEHLAAHRPLPE